MISNLLVFNRRVKLSPESPIWLAIEVGQIEPRLPVWASFYYSTKSNLAIARSGLLCLLSFLDDEMNSFGVSILVT